VANPWFRLYSEFASDPKVQSMPEIMQRRLIMLFCLRCSNVLETLHEDEIIFALAITPEEWETTKQLFVSKCFIRFISGKCNVINWNKRQFISDLSTDRVRKYRAKNETLQKRSKSVTVTPPDSDSDSETDKREENIIAPLELLKPEGQTKEITKSKPDPLYQAIFQSFIGKAGAFTNYPKEAQAIKRIIKYCEQHAPRYSEGDKIKLAEMVVTKYYELTQNGDRFWRGQPFTPSALSTTGIFDRVLVEIGQMRTEETNDVIPFY